MWLCLRVEPDGRGAEVELHVRAQRGERDGEGCPRIQPVGVDGVDERVVAKVAMSAPVMSAVSGALLPTHPAKELVTTVAKKLVRTCHRL